MSRCEQADRIIYRTADYAQLNALRIQMQRGEEKPMRVRGCEHCNGFHLTSNRSESPSSRRYKRRIHDTK